MAALERWLIVIGRSFTQPLMTAAHPKSVAETSLDLAETGRA
jgi:hypothetical protein